MADTTSNQQSDVLSRLVTEAVACAPKEWDHGTLTVQCDGKWLDYQLKNAEQQGKAKISDKLRDLIEELYVLMAGRGDVWTAATITFRMDGEEARCDASFQYAKPLNPPSAPQ